MTRSTLAVFVALFFPFLAAAQNLETERISGRDTAAREIIIKLQPGTTVQQIVQEFDADMAQPIGNAGLIRLRSRSMSAADLMSGASRSARAVWAEPNYILSISDTAPNDQNFGLEWGLRNTGQSVNGQSGLPFADINAVKAWDLTTGSSQILVGIIDTGIDYSHPDLLANIWSAPAPYQIVIGGATVNCPAGSHGFNAITLSCDPRDDHFHGTHVAGIIGARGNNISGVTGVNWTTSIVGFKFLNASGQGVTSDAINAITAAMQMRAQGINLRVLNASWGGSGFSAPLQQAISDAGEMLFVAAAGNFTSNNDASPYYPATYNASNIISVAATDSQDRLATFSNYGFSTVHLGAPGVDVYSTLPNANFGYLSGTSMAAPHVSGTAALLLSKCSLSTSDLKTAILSSVDYVGALGGRTITSGRLDAYKALNYCATLETPGFNLSVSPVSVSANLGGSATSQVTITTHAGFSSEVFLSATGLPPNVTALFSPASLTGSGSSTLTLSTSAATPAGSYPITVHAAGGSLDYTKAVNLTVNAPDFTVSASPGSVTAPAGGGAATTISVGALFGFSGVVNLTASGMPTGVTASFSPDSVTGAGGSTLTLSAAASTAPGVYLIAVQGASGTLLRGATVILTVTAPDFGLSATSGSLFLPPGNSAGVTIVVTALYGFNGAVDLTATGMPAGVSAAFVPASVTGTGGSGLTFTAAESTAPGSYPVTVRGVSGALTHTTTLTLIVATPVVVASTSLANGQVGVYYSQSLAASGGSAPYRWTATSGRLPRGLTLNESTGLISGYPGSVSSQLLTFAVTDSTAPIPQTATASLMFTVTDGAITITTASLASGQVGTAYSQALAAGGGTAPYTWSLSAGSLPNGMTLNAATGLIGGTPTAPANGALTFVVSDSSNPKRTATKVLPLTIAPLALSITTASLAGGQVGALYSQTLAASGGTGSYTWSIVGGALPNGLALNSFSGQIGGTPTATASTSLTFQVTDAGSPAQSATKVLTLTVTTVPLAISTGSLASGQVGAAYSQTLAAVGGSGAYSWAIIAGGGLPNGMTLNAATGQIGGAPTATANLSLTFQVTDSGTTAQSATKVLTLTVTQTPLVISTASLATGQVGSVYSQTLSAFGGAPSYTWAIIGGALPNGMTWNTATGEIGGAPTVAANLSLTFRVTDSGSPAQTATKVLSLTIAPVGLAITTASLANAEINAFYSQTLTASGGIAPYTWSTISGRLPRGLTLNASTGVMSGTPSAASVTPLVFQVTDSTKPVAKFATASLVLTVGNSGGALSITTASLADGQVGAAYSQMLSANGGSGSYTWALVSGALPNGLTLDPATGRIFGGPTAAANTSLTFQVSDSSAPPQTATKVLGLTVANAAPGLAITTTSLANGQVGVPYSQTLGVTGGTAPYTWRVASGRLPSGLSLNQSTGLISGTPIGATTGFALAFQVTDSSAPIAQTAGVNLLLTVKVGP